jgi:hypothetical protein
VSIEEEEEEEEEERVGCGWGCGCGCGWLCVGVFGRTGGQKTRSGINFRG